MLAKQKTLHGLETQKGILEKVENKEKMREGRRKSGRPRHARDAASKRLKKQ